MGPIAQNLWQRPDLVQEIWAFLAVYYAAMFLGGFFLSEIHNHQMKNDKRLWAEEVMFLVFMPFINVPVAAIFLAIYLAQRAR